MSKPLVSCLCGFGESVNPPELNIQEVQGALSSRSKVDPGPLRIFQDFFFYFCQITPLIMFVNSDCLSESAYFVGISS